MARNEPKKSGRRKWVLYERTHSNSMWHTDYKQLDDGRWFLCYEADASRFVTGYGVFEHATTENALTVLDDAIKSHGKPASIMADHGAQFYANEGEVKRNGESEFERRLVELEICQILARVRHSRPTASWRDCTGRYSAIFSSLRRYSCGKAIPSTCS